MRHQLIIGDCRRAMATMATGSVDAVVTDPPYELGFMGRRWDATGITYDPAMWRQALRVLRPGGHLLTFAATRTWHRMAVAVEDAGFDVRDTICAWLYGQGFPKSLDVSKAIAKAAGAERPVLGLAKGAGSQNTASLGPYAPEYASTAPATVEGARWDGWGSGLKPAWEPCLVARKPLSGTLAANVLEHGVGGLNVDGCRVVMPDGDGERMRRTMEAWAESRRAGRVGEAGQGQALAVAEAGDSRTGEEPVVVPSGRWPANVVFAHHPECEAVGERTVKGDVYDCHPDCWVRMLDQQSGTSVSRVAARGGTSPNPMSWGTARADGDKVAGHNDSGGASRFFPTFRYTAKAGSSERLRTGEGHGHETVKPLDLVRWLIRLVCPEGGTVLDPFAGSGTTLEAGHLEGVRVVGCELKWRYVDLSRQRAARVGADLDVTSVRRLARS